MSADTIPEELKSDHLFLLIGGNPLPNWVAARLLLREEMLCSNALGLNRNKNDQPKFGVYS